MDAYICKNRVFALIYRTILFVVGVFAIYMMMRDSSLQLFCYFTMQTNIFIVALFASLAVGTLIQIIKGGARGEVFNLAPAFQLAIIFFIQITFLVYATMLSDTIFTMGVSMAGVANILLHYVVPIASLIDWILFMPHGKISYKTALLWLIYPAAYVIFSFIRAEVGQPFGDGARYPYFFMDADVLGCNLLWVCPLFFAGFYALASLIVKCDKLIFRRINKEIIQ